MQPIPRKIELLIHFHVNMLLCARSYLGTSYHLTLKTVVWESRAAIFTSLDVRKIMAWKGGVTLTPHTSRAMLMAVTLFHKWVEFLLGVLVILSCIFHHGDWFALIRQHPLWWFPLIVNGRHLQHLTDEEREVYGHEAESRKINVLWENSSINVCSVQLK